MTKYLHDQPEHVSLWSHQHDILDNDLERLAYEKEAGSDVYNSILDEEPTYHSLMNFPEEEEENLYQYALDEYDDDDVFGDRDNYKNADRDEMYYFI
jgi:hypothetical protein